MRLLVPALASLLAATSSLAQDARPSVDLVAILTAGIAAEETAMVGDNRTAYVQQSAPGQFFGNTEEDGVPFTLFVTEREPCIFDVLLAMGATPPMGVTVNANLIKTVEFQQGDDDAGYTHFGVILGGADGIIRLIGRGDEVASATSQLGTSLTLDELNAAAAALQDRCPPA